MRIIVTGANGFIGRHLISSLKNDKAEVFAFNGDVLGFSETKEKYDIVVHLASVTGNENMSADRKKGFEVNVIGTYEIIKYCKKNKSSLILASTCGVYGETNYSYPISEESILNPTGDYSLSKFLSEELCRRNQSLNNLENCIILRLFNIYGKGQKKGFIIPDIIEAIDSNNVLKLRNPESVRDLVYVEDCVKAIKLSMELNGFHTFNISSGLPIRNREIVEMAEKILNISILVDLPLVQSKPSYSVGSYEKAKSILNWSPKIDFFHGLSEIILK